MIYNNLFIFITAIFLFSIDTVPDEPAFSGIYNSLLFFFLLLWFHKLTRVTFSKVAVAQPSAYFKAEKKLSVFSLFFFTAALHLCDAKYYLSFLPFTDILPALTNIGGLVLLLLFFTVIWIVSHRTYRLIFGGEQSTINFILQNIRINLPVVLPWIGLSLLTDIFTLLPWPWLQSFINSQWGDLLAFGIFLFFVLLFFPPMVRRLWGCTQLPDSLVKRELVSFCRTLNFKADLYTWPLFEGRVPTAGVMGMIPGLRYIVITPALLETMSITELKGVMAHEIGHIKRFHMLLYLLLIGGFSLFVGALSEPVIYFVLSRDFFYLLLEKSDMTLETLLTLLCSLPLLIAMLLYFRFLFGYFIRNFERQADIYSFTAMGSSGALVSAFEKLAMMSGNSKNQPNWHHFSLGERIDYLKRCEQSRDWVSRHNKKVAVSLLIFVLVLAIGVTASFQIPKKRFIEQYEQKYTEAIVARKIRQEPNNPLWLQLSGDIMLGKKMEKHARAAYEKVLELEPANPMALNNLAWLLLTSEDLTLRDPAKALTLARTASIIEPRGHVLDTLATAYWANGYLEEALTTETKAIRVDPKKRSYYRQQMELFANKTYEQSLADKTSQQ